MSRRMLLLVAVLAACSSKKSDDRAAGGSAAAGGAVASPDAPATPEVPVVPASAPDASSTPKVIPVPGSVPELGSGPDGRPYYYQRDLTAEDLEGRTLRDLALMRNTIFARAGHTFRKAWLRDHFTAQPWYRPLAKDDDSKITAVDRANAKKIADQESSFTRDRLVALKDSIAARAPRTPIDEVELELLSTRLGTWVGDAAAPAEKRSPLEDPQQLERLLTLDELSDLSRRDLRILRNTVYARRGREFRSDVLQDWFGGMDWYKGDASYSDARLTAVDKKNIRLIRSVEDQLGGPLSEHDHKEEDGWFQGA